MKNKMYCLLTTGVLFASSHFAFAQGTQFTYQGRLNSGTNPANGSYDLTFAMFNGSSGAGQVGNTITNPATTVGSGMFTVALDFGANFPGGDRWLEIGVRTNGNDAFTTLSPRQKLTPTPYAIHAADAGTLNGQPPAAFAPATGSGQYVSKAGDTLTGPLNLPANGLAVGGGQLVLANGNVGIGTSNPQTKLHVAGNATIDGELFLTGNQASGSRFVANQTLIIQTLNGKSIVLNPFDGGGDVSVGKNLLISGNVGIGTSSPLQKLHVLESADEDVALKVETTGNGRAARLLLQGNLNGFNSIKNIVNGTEAWRISGGESGTTADTLSFHTGSAATERMRVSATGDVGIGTATPSSKLDVAGAVAINGTTIINALGQWVGSPTGLVGPQGPPGAPGATGPQGLTGATGPQGSQGLRGLTGATGPQGTQGVPGPQGIPGAAGLTVRNGVGAPSSGLGVNGDFYINTTADTIYGPKTGGAWGGATSLIGPQGPQGPQGAPGISVFTVCGNSTCADACGSSGFVQSQQMAQSTSSTAGGCAASGPPAGNSCSLALDAGFNRIAYCCVCAQH